jgi:hypothetical protein
VETLKVVIVMIAKPFSLNKRSNQNTCKRNTGWMEKRGGRERQRDCEKLWRDCAKLCVYIDTCRAQNSYCTPTWRSRPVLGGSHFCETRPVLTLCYENLIDFRIYICMFGLVRTNQVLRIFNFSQLTQFSKFGDSCKYNNNRFSYPVFTTRFSYFLEINIYLFIYIN